MAETLQTVRDDVLRFLGDSDQSIWGGSEIEGYVKEGYDRLILTTRCLWTFGYLEDAASTATATLPADLHEIDRVTWNWQRLAAMTQRELARADYNYQTTTGPVCAFSVESDGLRVLRKWPVPASAASGYTITGTWGIARSVSDVTSETVTGTWGISRSFGTEAIGTWGFPRRPFKDDNNTRVEYFKRGAALGINQGFELPDRYVKYIRHFALWRAYGRQGDGQDLRLSAHYKERYERGVKRMVDRANRLGRQETIVLGGSATDRGVSKLAQWPQNFGVNVRYP